MDHEYIKQLLDKYFEGETSLKEERLLKDYFLQNDLSGELSDYKQHFQLLSDLKEEKLEKDDEWLLKKLDKPGAKQVFLGPWIMRIAAGLALLILGFAAGKWSGGNQREGDEQLVSLTNDVKEMKQMLMLTQMQQASASERIRAVSQTGEMQEANLEIIQALISTLNLDNNVNVRLAACEALYTWKNEPMVRKGLIQSLRNQQDPTVQITIIDMLVAMEEKEAITEIRKLANQKDVMGIVKTKALSGVSRLL